MRTYTVKIVHTTVSGERTDIDKQITATDFEDSVLQLQDIINSIRREAADHISVELYHPTHIGAQIKW